MDLSDSATEKPKRDSILAIEFGDVLPGGVGILSFIQIGTTMAGQPIAVVRDPLVWAYVQLETVSNFLPTLLAMLEERGMADTSAPAPRVPPPWRGGPKYDQRLAAGLHLAAGFGFAEFEPSDGGAIAILEAQSMLHPGGEVVSMEYVMSYQTLWSLNEALPKVLRKLVQNGQRPGSQGH